MKKFVKIVKIAKSVWIVKSVKTWKLPRLHLAHLLYTNFGIFKYMWKEKTKNVCLPDMFTSDVLDPM